MSIDESCLLMKVKIVYEVIACDVSPVAMFSNKQFGDNLATANVTMNYLGQAI